MHTVVILGTGNLARHLFEAFSMSDSVAVVQVYGRSLEGLSYFENRTEVTQNILELRIADTYIIAVSDDSIRTIAEQFTMDNLTVVHCSGAMPLDVLPPRFQRGVFYPLQSLSKGHQIDFSDVPICVEGETDELQSRLLDLGKTISKTCIALNTEQRLTMHLAAVYTNNFTNHLLYRASEICKGHNLPFSLLRPLLLETVKKLDELSPYEAQTGPARRNDRKTQQKHLAILSDTRDREIYTLLSRAIRETYGE